MVGPGAAASRIDARLPTAHDVSERSHHISAVQEIRFMANVVTTTGLTRRFGAITAVDRLSIEVPAAGVIGLVGPTGRASRL